MDAVKDKLIQDLSPHTLSPELIEKEKLIPENLFEVKIGSEVLGPFSGSFLKTFLAQKELDGLMVKNMESIIWIPFQQHSNFFTGEVKPVSPSEADRREFYLLVNGRKIGPYKSEDIEYKFKSDELLFTDLISDDEGAHWCKLYEMPHVDLRRHIGSELPPSPTTPQTPPNLTSEVQEHIGEAGELIKLGLEGIKEKNKKFVDAETNNIPEEKSLLKKSTNLLLLVAFVAFGGYLFEQFEVFKSKEKGSAVTVKNEVAAPSKTPIIMPSDPKIPEKRVIQPRTIKKVENKRPVRPPRYPAVPQPDPISAEADEIEPDEDLPLPEDDYLDEEIPKPRRTPPARTRSRPKPFEDNIEEPADDFVYD